MNRFEVVGDAGEFLALYYLAKHGIKAKTKSMHISAEEFDNDCASKILKSCGLLPSRTRVRIHEQLRLVK